MKKKIVTFFLLITLATQVLPIQQIGDVFFGNLLAEEIPHSSDLDKDDIKKGDVKTDFISLSTDNNQIAFTGSLFIYLLGSDVIPINHSAAIEVPPPNCFL